MVFHEPPAYRVIFPLPVRRHLCQKNSPPPGYFLQAVLPLFEELPKGDEASRKAIKGLAGVITFRAPQGLAAQVEMKDGTITVTQGKEKKSSITLFLPTVRMLNNLFKNKGFALPLPIWGIWNLKLVNAFTKLGERLNFYMAPNPEEAVKRGRDEACRDAPLVRGDPRRGRRGSGRGTERSRRRSPTGSPSSR